jgi:predicted Rossmann fold flavoprotein
MEADVLIVGAGAAGLAAALFAGRAARDTGRRVVVLDGARKPGAKILVSGGGRCNVTNQRVTPEDYWGGSRKVIRNVLRAFDEQRTLEWMRELGVELKLEPTGKYFPVSDSARTVLDALLRGVAEAGAELHAGSRVRGISREPDGAFSVEVEGSEPWRARRLVLATGGLSLPKSGSDGWGLAAARRVGHSIIPTTPALAPLLLAPGEGVGGAFGEFQGITIDARLALVDGAGRRLEERTGSLLFTHFGLSGPAALDLSRHWLRRRLENPGEAARVLVGHPDFPRAEDADRLLLAEAAAHPQRTVASVLARHFPERLARAMAGGMGTLATMTRESRRRLASDMAGFAVNVTGDRGYSFAETTAGGVDLAEIDHRTMESRVVAGLHLCGEMLDVDGRIGGFNFQWAWASGYLAGRAAGAPET